VAFVGAAAVAAAAADAAVAALIGVWDVCRKH
jgi:hypothetical protein